MIADDLRSTLRELILKALTATYTSISCHDGIITGNHYQSVSLGGTRTQGFRSDRGPFLDQIDFRGKTVLDLGSNLGEMSREARSRGAEFVDGWEYDEYFVQIANLVNAHNDVTRVSFSQADITDRTLYASEYDIVMAWSMWSYAGSVLPQIASITRELLVVETHKLDGNLERDYLEPIGRYFPHQVILGESDWGSSFDPVGGRSVILFYKQAGPISLRSSATEMSAADTVDNRLDGLLDVRKTTLAQRFFARFSGMSADELLAVIGRTRIDLIELSSHEDLRLDVYRSWEYWLLLVSGYLEYSEARQSTADNIYVRYLSEYYAPDGQDPGLVELVDPTESIARANARFADFDLFRDAVGGAAPDVQAIRVMARRQPHVSDDVLVFTPENEHPLRARLLDGHHRMFSAAFFGFDVLPYRLDIEPIDPPPLELLRYRVTSSPEGTFIEGAVSYPHDAELIEARRDGDVIGHGVLFPGTERNFRAQLLGAGAGDQIELLALHDWFPVAGTIIEVDLDP